MNFELLVATNNQHKLKEIRKILSPYHITVYGMKDLNINIGEVIENADTYYGNALIKAEALQKITTMPIIADDSGLEIEAMDNQPGLYSARYAESFGGHANAIKHILEEIEGKSRKAHFVCDIVLVNVEDKPLKFEAIIEGSIAKEVHGDSGFGYDPIFIEEKSGKTYAEMSEDEKNQVSHRGVALKKLLAYLRINRYAY